MCLALPHICFVHAECAKEEGPWVCAALYHSSKSNYRCAVDAARGETGRLHRPSLLRKVSLEEHEVDKLREPATAVEVIPKKVPEEESLAAREPSLSFDDLKDNVSRVLENYPDGILKSAFESKYNDVIGRKLESRKFGFFNTNALLRSLQGNLVDFKTSVRSKEVKIISYIK